MYSLPNELLYYAFRFFKHKEKPILSQVCKLWHVLNESDPTYINFKAENINAIGYFKTLKFTVYPNENDLMAIVSKKDVDINSLDFHAYCLLKNAEFESKLAHDTSIQVAELLSNFNLLFSNSYQATENLTCIAQITITPIGERKNFHADYNSLITKLSLLDVALAGDANILKLFITPKLEC